MNCYTDVPEYIFLFVFAGSAGGQKLTLWIFNGLFSATVFIKFA